MRSELSDGPIGLFDSGVGGLSVRRELVARLPREDTIYFADQLNVPYGHRGAARIRELCDAISGWLLARRCKTVVVACNTASAAALHTLRERHPEVPMFGMEPAVKPAASATRSGVVGIMATPATFDGQLFRETAMRWASAHRLVTQICEGLVEQVEAGRLEHPETDALLERALKPMLAAGADTLVLACTHYSFLTPAIRRLAGPGVEVIDPAPAVARHVHGRLAELGLLADRERDGRHQYATTGAAAAFGALAANLSGVAPATVEHVELASSTADAPPRAAARD